MKNIQYLSVVVGGAPAQVVVLRGDLLLEWVSEHEPEGCRGFLFVWETEGLHDLSLILWRSRGDVAFISEKGRILEVHSTDEPPFKPGYPFKYAALMESDWFDRHCTSSRCTLALD